MTVRMYYKRRLPPKVKYPKMFRSILVFSCIAAYASAIDTCSGGALPGCSVAADCPPAANNGAMTCIPTAATATDPAGTCCPSDQVVVTATTAATGTTAACVDKLNPRSGVSDCTARAALCNDAVYFDVMTRQCPKTCGRCGVTGTATTTARTTVSTACIDLLNPRTGTSDCVSLKHLCSDSTYYALMTVQCPKTCGRCGMTGVTGATTTATSTCADRVNTATGTSECAARVNLCQNSQYRTLMQEECPRTCGFCT